MKSTFFTYQSNKALKAILIMMIMIASIHIFAAKGDSKAKKGVVLKFNGFDFKGTSNFSLFSKSGFLLKGSFNQPENQPINSSLNSVITFQKGNTTFIYPYKFKVSVPYFKTPTPIQR